MENLRILLVEDDLNLGLLLKEYLEAKGCQPLLCRDGEEGWASFTTQTFDFCILDVMLPRLDGFALAERIRGRNAQIPLIFLTAKSLKEDTIHGLKIGADDYLTKPFRMEELLLRMQAILRRVASPVVAQMPTTTLQAGLYTLDTMGQKLNHPEGEQKLTSKESELLALLIAHKNQVLDRTTALKKVWGNDSYFNARSMDVYLTKLRKYLRADPRLQILNVHGQGFKLVELQE